MFKGSDGRAEMSSGESEVSRASVERVVVSTIDRVRSRNPENLAVQRAAIQCAFARDGMCVTSLAFGARSSGRAIRVDDVMPLASQTKPLVAMLALSMMTKGLLELDRPIGEILEKHNGARVADIRRVCGDAFRVITPRHLLSHTSGFARAESASRALAVFDCVATAPAIGYHGPRRERSDTDWLAVDAPVRLMNQPGTVLEYSAVNFALVGALLECVGGESIERLFDSLIAQPLGLESLAIPDDAGSQRALHAAACGGFDPQGLPTPGKALLSRASSGGVGTAKDLAVLSSTLGCAGALRIEGDLKPPKSQSGAIISAELIREATRVQSVNGERQRFGLGFAISEWPPLTVCKHAGYAEGCTGITEGLLELGCAVSVIVTASAPPGKRLAQAICADVLDHCRERLVDDGASGPRSRSSRVSL